jgi:hypothetical protein
MKLLVFLWCAAAVPRSSFFLSRVPGCLSNRSQQQRPAPRPPRERRAERRTHRPRNQLPMMARRAEILTLLLTVVLLLVTLAVAPPAARDDPALATAAEEAGAAEAAVPEETPEPVADADTEPTDDSPPPPPSPRRSAVCDSMHCDGCGTVPECEAVKECIWHPHEHYCHVREIKLFGHTIDLVKLHNKEV